MVVTFRCHVRFSFVRGDLDHFYKKVPDSSIFSSLASFQEHLLFRPAERERERQFTSYFCAHWPGQATNLSLLWV